MAEKNATFYVNAEGMDEAGAISFSAADKSYLKIYGLNRDTALTAAHELTKRLDALGATGREFNDKNFSLPSSLSQGYSREFRRRKKIFDTAPALGNFSVKVTLPAASELKSLGNEVPLKTYSVIAEVAPENKIKGTKSIVELGDILQTAYGQIMERYEFFTSTNDVEMDLEQSLKDLGVPIYLDRNMADTITEQEVVDEASVEEMLISLGVKGIEQNLLDELCEIKKWTLITVVDLYLHELGRKRQKSNYYPPIFLKDLVQRAETVLAPALRDMQETAMRKGFKKMGFADDVFDDDGKMIEEGTATKRYRLYKEQKNEGKMLAMRYIGWLSQREFMTEFVGEVAEMSATDKEPSNIKIFELASAYLYNRLKQHRNDRHKNYNLSVDWERDEYNNGLTFHRTLVLLCLSIFYEQDISTFKNRE